MPLTNPQSVPPNLLPVLQAYATGTQTGDVALLHAAFHSGCPLQTVQEGAVQAMTYEAFTDMVARRGTSGHTVTYLSAKDNGTAAFVELRFDFGTHHFIDYLTLLHTAEDWRIVSKVYVRFDG